jgi:hypothetical protein
LQYFLSICCAALSTPGFEFKTEFETEFETEFKTEFETKVETEVKTKYNTEFNTSPSGSLFAIGHGPNHP